MNARSDSIASPISSLWRIVARLLRRVDEIVHEPVDPLGARGAEQLDLRAGQVGVREDPVADRVVDVVVDVGDAVDDADDLPLERLRLLRAGVREDAVADLVGEVEPQGDAPATARCAGSGGRTRR